MQVLLLPNSTKGIYSFFFLTGRGSFVRRKCVTVWSRRRKRYLHWKNVCQTFRGIKQVIICRFGLTGYLLTQATGIWERWKFQEIQATRFISLGKIKLCVFGHTGIHLRGITQEAFKIGLKYPISPERVWKTSNKNCFSRCSEQTKERTNGLARSDG